VAQQLRLQGVEAVARARELLRPLEHERSVERDGGEELEVRGREGPGAAVVEIENPARGRAQGHAEDGPDAEALDALRLRELRVLADVRGEDGQAALHDVADDAPAQRPLVRRPVGGKVVGEARAEALAGQGQEAGAVGLEVRDDGVVDRLQHRRRVRLLEELAADRVDGAEAARAQRGAARGQGPPRIERGLGVGPRRLAPLRHLATIGRAPGTVNGRETVDLGSAPDVRSGPSPP
jgi:hypothetical protein